MKMGNWNFSDVSERGTLCAGDMLALLTAQILRMKTIKL
jgi:hypothetical protein